MKIPAFMDLVSTGKEYGKQIKWANYIVALKMINALEKNKAGKGLGNVDGGDCHLLGWSRRPVEKVTFEQAQRNEERVTE